jgi:hypothetical protein
MYFAVLDNLSRRRCDFVPQLGLCDGRGSQVRIAVGPGSCGEVEQASFEVSWDASAVGSGRVLAPHDGMQKGGWSRFPCMYGTR